MATWNLYGPGTEYVYGTNSNDVVNGSVSSSMVSRMYGGNDTVNVYAGFNNFVNGNWGNDTIEIIYTNSQGGVDGSGGKFLGGSGDDTLTNYGGSVYRVNGNNGNDYVVGVKGADGEFRGGADNDILSVYNGRVFGDKGYDTFVMRNPAEYSSGSSTDYAWVQDYTPGQDQVLYSSSQGNVTYLANQNGLWLYQNNTATMLLSGISSIDQVTLTAS